jgi:acetyl-CoA carboxylase, biotin carboxylase subunit
VRTVAIFSEADRESLHVRQADEAFCVGPGPVPRSYLNIPNIISTALITGCDAIHPGYGFLAENARFAQICADHGLTFIGPKPEVIAAMGDKATAKRVMREAGVATTPGTDILDSIDEAIKAGSTIGYPVLLKATAGGGGKGMRVVESAGEMERAYASATAEAEASFKDGRVYMEKLIIDPRHIEVQVLGDEFGNVVTFGERDCSVQKPSHQKLIEESPAPHLSDRARAALLDMAVRACKHVRYSNAGTLEFLVSGNEVFFMEMNTRIQVEHPVTEMVYSVDLVKEQIRGRRAARLRPARPSAARPCDRVSYQCGRSAQQFRAAGRHAHQSRLSRRPGCARRHACVFGSGGSAVLRLDDREGDCFRRIARSGDRAHGARAA